MAAIRCPDRAAAQIATAKDNPLACNAGRKDHMHNRSGVKRYAVTLDFLCDRPPDH
jgi:hypothetical protein